MSHSVGCRGSSDPMLLWLWCKPAAATPIPSLAQELPHTTGMAINKKRKKNEVNHVVHELYLNKTALKKKKKFTGTTPAPHEVSATHLH